MCAYGSTGLKYRIDRITSTFAYFDSEGRAVIRELLHAPEPPCLNMFNIFISGYWLPCCPEAWRTYNLYELL